MNNYMTKLNDLTNNISEYVYYKQVQGDMESVARWEAILERLLNQYADLKGIEW